MGTIINKVKRGLFLFEALIIRSLIKTKKHRIFCWEFKHNKCGGSPKYFAEYVLNQPCNNFEIYFAFSNDFDVSNVDRRYHIVRYPSLKYLMAMYSSRFVLYNARNNFRYSGFIKKSDQKYIMTWHGATPIKRIEKDIENTLNIAYVAHAKEDSKMCDLMLSNGRYATQLIRRAFWYDGEILEKGIPCNDVFFNDSLKASINEKIRDRYHIPSDHMIVMYGPTFREYDETLEPYRIDWNKIIPVMESVFGRKITVLVRLHPHLVEKAGIDSLADYPNTINVSNYPDTQELMCAMDILITDYSSIMFDAIILDKPCFLLCRDKDKYERDFYFKLEDLPFPLAYSESGLINQIIYFDWKAYVLQANCFKKNVLGIMEDGNASKALYEWMLNHME